MIQYFRRKGFDDQDYTPEYDRWLELDSWTLWEAVFLALGENPLASVRETNLPNLDHQFTQAQEQLLARAILAAVETSRPLKLHFKRRRSKKRMTLLNSKAQVHVLVEPFEFVDWVVKLDMVKLPGEMSRWHAAKILEREERQRGGHTGKTRWGDVLTHDHPDWQPISYDQRARILEDKGLNLLVDGREFSVLSKPGVMVSRGQLDLFLHFVEPGEPHAVPSRSLDQSGVKASLAKLRRLCGKLGIPRDALLKKHSEGYGHPLSLSFPPREGFRFAILRPE